MLVKKNKEQKSENCKFQRMGWINTSEGEKGSNGSFGSLRFDA